MEDFNSLITEDRIKELLSNNEIIVISDFGPGSLYQTELEYSLSDTLEPTKIYSISDIEPNNANQTAYCLNTAFNLCRESKKQSLIICGVQYIGNNQKWYLVLADSIFSIVSDLSFMSTIDHINNISYELYELSFHAESGYFGIKDLLISIKHKIISLKKSDLQIPDYQSTGKMIFKDRFGNIISDIYLDEVSDFPKSIRVRDRYEIPFISEIKDIGHLTPIAYRNSDGFIEIAISSANAAKELNVRNGQDITAIY